MQVHPETNPLDLLTARIAALELRVASLEHPSQTVATPGDEIAPPAEHLEPAASASAGPGAGTAFTGAFSVLGAALLGIAGAYVLRAIAEASLLPRGVVAGLAAVYATGWLLTAARRTAQPLAASLFAGTSILILAPMLWEMSIRFRAMSAAGAAGYLIAYAAIATIVGFRLPRSTAFMLAISGSALITVALSIATHSIALFTAVLLTMYAVVELSSLRDRARGVRILIVLCADASAWALLYIYSLPPREQTGYPPLGSAAILAVVLLLFAIQIVSVVIHAVRRAQPVEVFAVLQVMISFALLVFGVAWFVPSNDRQAIGSLCLLLAVCGYAAAYGPIRRAAQSRNLGIFVVWSSALFFAAVFLLASPTVASAVLGILAVAAIPLSARMQARSIEAQGTLFLCTAAFASGLLSYAFNALAGKMPGLPAWPVVLVAAAACLAYAAAGEHPGELALNQALRMVQALVAACGVAALLARGLVGLAAFVLTPAVFHIAVLRTLALCVMAVALTWLGAHLGRLQMMRVAYMALALAAVKLLFEDLLLGRMEFIAVSIFLVALTFISVPRLARTPTLGQPAK
jgi:hypothetical protein